MRDIIAGPLYPSSSWIKSYAYGFNEGVPGLFIDYKDALCFYPYLEEISFFGLSRAKSKGKWVWDNIINYHYEKLTGSL